jgi:hypothetical protein
MVCTEYGEIYCLTKDALMEVAELYEGVCVCVCVCEREREREREREIEVAAHYVCSGTY